MPSTATRRAERTSSATRASSWLMSRMSFMGGVYVRRAGAAPGTACWRAGGVGPGRRSALGPLRSAGAAAGGGTGACRPGAWGRVAFVFSWFDRASRGLRGGRRAAAGAAARAEVAELAEELAILDGRSDDGAPFQVPAPEVGFGLLAVVFGVCRRPIPGGLDLLGAGEELPGLVDDLSGD